MSSATNYCFMNCVNLSAVSLPICSVVGYSTFAGAGLLTVNLPKCTIVDQSAFMNCKSLSVVSLGSGCSAVDNIAGSAFYGCSNLKSLYLLAEGDNGLYGLTNSTAFTGTPIANGTGKIYVKATMYSSYMTYINNSYYGYSAWSYFKSRFVSI